MEHDLSTQRNWYHTKFISLTFFVTIDSYLNSKSEYEALQPSLSDLSDYDKDHHDSSIDTITQLQIIFFGCSILVQVSIFAVFFLILCDTYPFQIGLISVLTSRFKFPILTHQVYVSLGIIIGVMRMIFVGTNTNVWTNGFYSTASFVHKIVAPCFYASQFRAALALGDEKYYTKDSWIATQPR